VIIPLGYAHVQHFFGGTGLPNGAAVTYGIAGFGASSAYDAALQLHLDFGTNWLPQLSNTARLEKTRVKYGPNATGPFAEYAENIVGGTSGTQMPPNVALLVEKKTAVGGKSGAGRLYIPGIPEAVAGADGAIAPANMTAFQTVANAWLADIETTFTGMVLLHSASSDPTAVTNLVIDPLAATQRRRLR
jgi:hypothetical protein